MRLVVLNVNVCHLCVRGSYFLTPVVQIHGDIREDRCADMQVFFFQAEDGIRDLTVTGVQTCALPIYTIVQSEMEAADWYYKVWQSFAVLLPVQSVDVMGDQRTYENTIVLRIVESQDGMTADWVRLAYELLGRISARISNEVKGFNRVCYDISSKPPSTIEWE